MAMQNRSAISIRNFDPMSIPGLSHKARDAVNAAFEAMSTWRSEVADNSEKNIKRVIEKMAAAAAELVCALGGSPGGPGLRTALSAAEGLARAEELEGVHYDLLGVAALTVLRQASRDDCGAQWWDPDRGRLDD